MFDGDGRRVYPGLNLHLIYAYFWAFIFILFIFSFLKSNQTYTFYYLQQYNVLGRE